MCLALPIPTSRHRETTKVELILKPPLNQEFTGFPPKILLERDYSK